MGFPGGCVGQYAAGTGVDVNLMRAYQLWAVQQAAMAQQQAPQAQSVLDQPQLQLQDQQQMEQLQLQEQCL